MHCQKNGLDGLDDGAQRRSDDVSDQSIGIGQGQADNYSSIGVVAQVGRDALQLGLQVLCYVSNLYVPILRSFSGS